MKKQVYEVDSNGLLINIHIDDTEETEFIAIDPPQGLYRPKWNGSNWIEDMPQTEIDNLNNQPIEKTEVESLREQLNATSSAIDFLLMNLL